jgi:hypothetical protein
LWLAVFGCAQHFGDLVAYLVSCVQRPPRFSEHGGRFYFSAPPPRHDPTQVSVVFRFSRAHPVIQDQIEFRTLG